MHSLLDRGTILAGLVEELRPLLPTLGGALGDLCAGFGQAEAGEQALETAFMIRAAAEMLELDALAEAARLVEQAVPLLQRAGPGVLKESRPVVQSLTAAVEQATEVLLEAGGRVDGPLEAARAGVARLRDLGAAAGGTRAQGPDLEAMLATLPDVPDEVVPPPADEPPFIDALAEAEAAGAAQSPWAAQLAPPGTVPAPMIEDAAEERSPIDGGDGNVQDFGDFDLLRFLDLTPADTADPAESAAPAPDHLAGLDALTPLAGEEPSPAVGPDVNESPSTEPLAAATTAFEPVTFEPAGFVSAACEPRAIDAEPELAANEVTDVDAGQSEIPAVSAEPAPASSPAVPASVDPTEQPAAGMPSSSPPPPPATITPWMRPSAPAPSVERTGLFSQFLRNLRAPSSGPATGGPAITPLPVEPVAGPAHTEHAAAATAMPGVGAAPASPRPEPVPSMLMPAPMALPVEPAITTVEPSAAVVESPALRGAPPVPSVAPAVEPVAPPIEPAAVRPAMQVLPALPAPLGPIQPAPEAEIDPEILEVFMLEARDVLAAIEDHLATVRQDPGDRVALAELRRASHTLKGAANVVGFAVIGGTCKAMEELLDALGEAERTPDAAARDFFTASYEAVRALVAWPSDPTALATAARLQAEGRELTLGASVQAEPSAAPAADADARAWERAVEAFLADDEETEAPAAANLIATPDAPEAESEQGELVAVFAVEAEEHLTRLSGAALRLDLDPNDGEALAEARRTLHTLKGSAGALGLELISALCHETESRLESERPDTMARLLFEAAEALEQALGALSAEADEEAIVAPEAPSIEASVAEATTEHTVADEPRGARDLDRPIRPESTEPSPAAVGPTSGATVRPEPAEEAAPTGTVRVELGRVDELMNVVGELVLTRGNLEQRLERVGRSAEELRLTVARLRRVAQYLEDRYEVAELIRTAPDEPRRGEFDELELDRYTELHRVSREVTELAADAETTSDELELSLKELDTLVTRQARLGTDLQDRLMAVRLVPLTTLGTRLHRTVRSVALKQGKEVEFALRGGETELDKRVAEELGDVLLHLVRNAVDHGIEAPADRLRLGKPATGGLTVRAFREGSEAIVQVADDGGGIDLERLRQRAELLGLIRRDQDLDEQELLDLIFQPGLSTSAVADEVSGRGVGLDVVRATVRRLKGSIEVESRAGEGTTFTLRLPVLLAVVQAMLVRAGDQPYAIPMAAIERVVQTEVRPTIQLGRVPMIELDGEGFPFAELGAVLGQQPSVRPNERRPLLVVRAGERRVAVAVDGLLDQQEVVVKALGSHLRSVRGVLGATIQTNGEVLLVLNTAELLTARALMLGGPGQLAAARQAEGPLHALVVDDSLSVRKVLARALERDGWEVRQARDGVDALEVLQSYRPNVVLMDIEMPRMDGFELASVLRDVADYGRPPVVMITSRAGEKHRQRAEELGVAGYVVKPYQEPELMAMLRHIALVRARG